MIKFFRKIRQNSLLEGKTGKYLKYAIGEIILVMIGILLALQVNNWNQLQKANKNEIEILGQIKNALQNNKETLKNRIELYKGFQIDGNLLEKHLNERLSYSDTLQGYFIIPTRDFSFGISYSTYENVKNQGFNIITNDTLRLKIIKLYDEQFGLLKDQESKAADLLPNIMQLAFKYFHTSPNGFKPNDYELLLNSLEYSNVLSFMMTIANQFEILSKNSNEEIDKLLSLIEKEIENRE